MIATDLDDTLLRSDKTVSPRAQRAIQSCRAQGIRAIYATARGETARRELPPGLFDGCALMNGALGFAGEAPVYERRIPAGTTRDMLIRLDALGLQIAAQVHGLHHANFDVCARWPNIPRDWVTGIDGIERDADKLYTVIERPEQVGLIRALLGDALHMYVSRDNLAMIMHSEASKSSAVLAIAAAWGIAPGEIVAFGDDLNDIDMLRACGIGVAMGNASDEVRAAADQVCATNEQDGLAEWLEKNLPT